MYKSLIGVLFEVSLLVCSFKSHRRYYLQLSNKMNISNRIKKKCISRGLFMIDRIIKQRCIVVYTLQVQLSFPYSISSSFHILLFLSLCCLCWGINIALCGRNSKFISFPHQMFLFVKGIFPCQIWRGNVPCKIWVRNLPC